MYLYRNGVLNPSYTTNAKTTASNYIGFTLNQSTADFTNSSLVFSPKVDVTNYKTLIVDISLPTTYSAWGFFGLSSVYNWRDNGSDFVSKVGLRYGSESFPVITYTLDITNQTGEYYLKGSTYNAGLLVYGLRLEP